MDVLLGKNLKELQTICKELGLPAFTAKQMAEWMYKKQVPSILDMTNLSKAARETLSRQYSIGNSAPVEAQHSKDGTIKYLYQTSGGQYVESVYIPDKERGTLCVSSQVGCKMNCAFCMTGRQGFEGQLSTADILNQLYALPEREKITNIVFMGQGEPMDNIDNVLRATDILTADYGYAWSPKRITVSTVGIKKGLIRFLQESSCHLAISLHSPFPEERETFMPAEKAFSLTEMIDLLKQYDFCRNHIPGTNDKRITGHQRRLSFEYIVFDGFNDSPRHAAALAKLLKGLDCRVNLIRFHTIPNTSFKKTNEETLHFWQEYLNNQGITTTIRASRGQDIFAACGLLTTAHEEEEKHKGKDTGQDRK